MALRKILTEGDEQLLKHSRKVEKFDDRLHTLIDDMRETLENSGGVGLAAPQVGILRRVVVLLDVNKEPEEMVELVNPEVIEQKGSERVVEGCLSVPGVYGYVTRPTWAKIRAQDRNGNWFEREGEGIVAQCFCHETEHLTVICSPRRSRSISTRRQCRVVTRNNAYRIHGHAGLRRAEPAGAHRRRT